MESEINNINLQLGDIIQIDSASNSELHDKIFYINFINNNKIVLISEEKILTLDISEEGKLLEESIDNIILLHRQLSPSFIIQNNIKTNKYISIYFGEPLPSILNGIVTNIEEDMIEITLIPNKEIIYIDFAYSGIPENLNIEKIVVRDNKDELKTIEDIEEDKELSKEDIDYTEEKYLDLDNNEELDYDLINHKNDDEVKKILLDSIVFENDTEELYHTVNVPENEKRYAIEMQATDFMDNMISKYNKKFNYETYIENLNKELNRFKELRLLYSNFDSNNIPHIPEGKTEFNKPLKELLYNLNKKIYWILPIVSYKKNVIYQQETQDSELYDDFLILKSDNDFIRELKNVTDRWIDNSSKEKINEYKLYINNLLNIIDNLKLNTDYEEELNLEVKTQLDVINDMFDDFYSYSIKLYNKELNINKERFLREVVIEGTKMLEINTSGDKKINKSIELTPNNKIKIIGFLTLPLSIFNFSKINMNYSNILEKSNLNNNFLNYYKLLNNNTIINKYILDDRIKYDFINSHNNIHNNNILNNISNFSIDSGILLSNEEKYNLLLESFIPTNNKLIDILASYKEFLNFESFYNESQCANIDKYTLDSKDYNKLIKLINDNIIKYKENYFKNKDNLGNLLNILNKDNFKDVDIYDKASLDFNLLSREIKDELLEIYNITEKEFISKTEIISRFFKIDNCRHFSNTLNKNIMDLIITDLVDNLLKKSKLAEEQESKNVEEEKKIEEMNDKCNKYYLSKKYNSIENLEYDNDREIFFDSIYDNTLYSLINEYIPEKNSMDTEKFIEFLTDKIIDIMNITKDKAKREAISIVNEKREIIDGDYALLIDKETNKNYIYIRDKRTWILDESFKDDFYIDSNKILCDKDKDCISLNDKCMSMEKVKKNKSEEQINKILENFKLKYNLSIEEIRANIDINYESSKKYLKNIININRFNQENINRKLLELYTEEDTIIISPYEYLRDTILSLKDIIKKNNYIKKFCLQLTRESINDENNYWLYCNKTNVKLIPKFLLKLANVFDDKIKYLRELDTICAEQGTISDDNSYWVDKHSGYIIKSIEFSNDEGFDDQGYKLNTKELLQDDYNVSLINKQKILSPDIDTINAIIKAMINMMGIKINNNEFIINNVLKIQKKSIPSKEEYEKQIEKLVKKDKKSKSLPSYEDTYNSSLLLLTLSFLIVNIQSSIPSIKTKKTFPGCIKSFSGYPFEGDQDKTTIMYIACIANKIKSSIKPWNSILKTSELNIVKKLDTIIKTHILTNKEVNELFDKKREYLLLNETETIPEEISINSWHNFMPALIEINIDKENLIPLPDTLKDELIESLTKGKKNNIKEITQSKIIYLSNEIINSIQKITKTHGVLLENNIGEPYLENACCNSTLNTIEYFTNKDKSIIENNALIFVYKDLIDSLNSLSKSAILYNNENTKNIFSTIKKDFNEIIIYKTFIHFCNFNNDIPIDDELKSICIEKPLDFINNNNILDTIENLKSQGKVYTKDNLLELLSIIGKRNFLQFDSTIDKLNNSDLYKLYIEEYKSIESEDKIDDLLFEKLDILFENIQINNSDNKYLDNVKNYISKVNTILYNKILEYIKKIPSLNKQTFKLIESMLNIDVNINNVKFHQNYINNLLSVFPNIIIKKNIDYSAIPKHWNLSTFHNSDIINIIKSYYEELMTFSEVKEFELVFKIINNKCSILQKLINITLYNEKIKISNSSKEQVIYSIFDSEFIKYFYTYVYYTIFNELININHNTQFKLEIAEYPEYDPDTFNDAIFNFINIFLKIMNKHYNILNNNYKKIKEKIQYSKEKEKDLITDYLKSLTDEEREIENLFKNNKLEKWSKGLQKGLTQYVKENYDEERAEIIEQAKKEYKLKQNNNVTEMNKEIYKIDMEEQEKIDKEIDNEEYSMSNIPDDDDADSEYEYEYEY